MQSEVQLVKEDFLCKAIRFRAGHSMCLGCPAQLAESGDITYPTFQDDWNLGVPLIIPFQPKKENHDAYS